MHCGCLKPRAILNFESANVILQDFNFFISDGQIHKILLRLVPSVQHEPPLLLKGEVAQ
jgi:hypothetical protein